MSPEFGSTCAIFPVDAETLRYLEFSGRPAEQIELVEAYTKEQGMFHDEDSEDATYSDTLELDLSTVEPSLAGPKRPQDRVALSNAATDFLSELADQANGIDGDRGGNGSRGSLPGQRPAVLDGRAAGTDQETGSEPETEEGGIAVEDVPHASAKVEPRRRGVRPGGRRGGDRRDHQLHQHLQPVGHARRGHPRPQRRRARACSASRG